MASTLPFCGCWYLAPPDRSSKPNFFGQPHSLAPERRYLRQVDLSSHTTILAATSRTVLTQKYINPADSSLDEVQYTFPLYDGVSVVGFKCTVASRTIVGVVKEKQQARAEYKAAIDRGETAGLLEQMPEAADVFTTRIGNVPAKEAVTVEIVYLGELKHDAETDGVRFTIPTVIAPRYGQVAADRINLPPTFNNADDKGGIRIVVDVAGDPASSIRGLQSPSHPIAVSMGRTSSTPEESDSFNNHLASATLTLGSTELEKDFVVVVLAEDQDTPRAMLEQHPTIPGQRALMATLVPKFNLPAIHPEIVFVVDRSGSMEEKIDTLVAALKIFLKSLPVGVKFNICSFGTSHTFLWPKSKTYDQSSLQTALDHLKTFEANYGGTEMLRPIVAVVENRYKDMLLEVMVITDGQIWNQDAMFEFINKATAKGDTRFFSLGVGAGASSSLVEGIARAGNGFAQFVGDGEKMDKRVVRMLKGALMPHVHDYILQVKYEKDDDDFEIVESVTDLLGNLVTSIPDSKASTLKAKTISLFNKSATKETTSEPPAGRYDHLPVVPVPKLLQTPHKIPPLYPFNRTTVYLLMSAEACQRTPEAVILRATSEHGPLELEIPIVNVGVGQTIHQLAAKKAIHELEEGRGWITEAKNNGKLIKDQNEGRWDEMVEKEAVRLGVQFQVSGKWCAFVAVDANSGTEESNGSATQQQNTPMSPPFGVSQQAPRSRAFRDSFGNTSQGTTIACAGSRQSFLSTPSASRGLFGQPSAAPPGVSRSFSSSRGLSGGGGGTQASTKSYFGMSASASKSNTAGDGTGVRYHTKFLPSGPISRKPELSSFAALSAAPSWDIAARDESLEKESSSFSGPGAAKRTTTPQTIEDRVHALIALQKYDGSWAWTADLFAVLGMDEKKLHGICVSRAGLVDLGQVRATVVAVAFLQTQAKAEKEIWEMVVEKALNWLKGKADEGQLRMVKESIAQE